MIVNSQKKKDGTQIKCGNKDLIVVGRTDGRKTIKTIDNRVYENTAYNWIKDGFEILSEEDKEIDIQALQETIIGDFYDADGNIDVEEISNIFNDITKAIKQLDKKIK